MTKKFGAGLALGIIGTLLLAVAVWLTVAYTGAYIALEAQSGPQEGSTTFSAPGTTVTVRPLGDEADWRQNAELVFELEEGLSVGYRGFYGCAAG